MSTIRSMCLVTLCAFAAGCAAPLMSYSTDVPALELRVVGQPGAEDGRARFREIFCAVMESAPGQDPRSGCERYLVRLVDEAPGMQPLRALPPHNPRLRILFVPGAFGECFADVALPYPEAIARLSQQGYAIDIVRVSGRSGTAHNAAQIAQAVAEEPVASGEKLVLMGYSKGTPDILEFLVGYPDLARRVDAVVSIAGAVDGTPLADVYAGAYAMVADVELARCGPGDGAVMDSLRQGTRMNWLARNRLPRHVRYFSLGAFARPEDIGRLMFLTEQRLVRAEPLQDGQMLFYHQLIPGSTLLGYAYGDHWAVTLPLQEKWPFWAGNSAGSSFPRAALFEAIVLYLVEALSDDNVGAGTSGDPRVDPVPSGQSYRNLVTR